MSDLSYVLSSLKSRWLNSFLSILLTAFGVSIALLVTQFGDHLQKRLTSDGKGIDIVVGAKGSPLQLILSSIYHIDIPNGNIDYQLAQNIVDHPQIKKVIPLALGDNWKGYRIVGTTHDYIKHYSAKVSKGNLWNDKFEAVVGSSVSLKMNERFQGAHGLLEGGDIHEDIRYTVTGVMKPTGTVLDRLILTSLDSVLEIHGHEHVNQDKHEDGHKSHEDHEEHEEHVNGHKSHEDHEENEEHMNGHKSHEDHEEHEEHWKSYKQKDHQGHENHKEDINKVENKKSIATYDNKNSLISPEITALLLTTKSPIANMNLPRLINQESSLQAANPAFEITRLTSMLGLGSKTFKMVSIILISISALSIFSGLAGNMENRIGDLSILRAIGYSKKRIFKIITLEGMIIILNGIFLGIIMGLGGFKIITEIITPLNISHANISLNMNFLLIIVTVFIAGLVAAIFPAYHYSKVSLANQLSNTT
ncbi:ABC transporter permease [Rickettsiales bacterium]|nr:ABC transporter permease [Rickettsiales bacterium]